MGGKQRPLLNLVVMRVVSDPGLLFVTGNVPGAVAVDERSHL
jgi:ribosomal protein L3